MSDLAVVNAEIVEARSLTDIETSIKGHLATFVKGTMEAVEARIAVGHDLLEAREQFGENDKGFGQWCGERFPWSREWRSILVRAAENETAVRSLLSTQVDGRDINFKKLVLQAANGTATAQHRSAPAQPPAQVVTGTYSTIVADPPWQYDNKATRGAAEDHYSTMTVDDIMDLEVPAAEDAHLYLWVTNAFIRTGFDIMETWGFTYKTCLTWTKPQIGLGNYFRNATEHVLFGVKGSLPTTTNDQSTWFQANRGKHSAKPESFYDIVERSSPGPYLEMFARRRRMGWEVWGDEA